MRLVLAFLVAGGVACTRPTDDAHDADVVAHVKGWLSDLEADDDATAAKAVTALEALGPADAGAVPVLLTALSCPPEAANGVGADDHQPRRRGAGPRSSRSRPWRLQRPSRARRGPGARRDRRSRRVAVAHASAYERRARPYVRRVRPRADGAVGGTDAARGARRPRPAHSPRDRRRDPQHAAAARGRDRSDRRPSLTDADPEVRMQAADTLGHFGAAAVPELVPAFEDAASRASGRASPAPFARSGFRHATRPPRSASTSATRRRRLRLERRRGGSPPSAPTMRASVAALAAALEDGDHTVRWGARRRSAGSARRHRRHAQRSNERGTMRMRSYARPPRTRSRASTRRRTDAGRAASGAIRPRRKRGHSNAPRAALISAPRARGFGAATAARRRSARRGGTTARSARR